MKKLFETLLNNERGFALVIVSIGMVSLLGMMALVSDFGRIALTRQRLVNAVDSGALAGSLEFSRHQDPLAGETYASQKAMELTVINGAPLTGVSVNVSNGHLTVEATQKVEMIFSRLFDIQSRNVRARATAVVGALSSCTGIAPLSIREQPLDFGQLATLKFGSPDSPGNFGALALAGKGASNYKNNLINGFSQEVHIGDELNTEPGNMSGPTDGIDQRLARCNDGCTFDNFRPDCPRILVIPMYDNDISGRDQIIVTGFAAFFVDRAIGSTDEIKGYFVRMASEGNIDTSKPANALYGAKLIE